MMKKMGDEVLDECMRERYGLAKERIREIRTEETVKEPFGDFFRKMAQFLFTIVDTCVVAINADRPVHRA